jgi:hypothetical protein
VRDVWGTRLASALQVYKSNKPLNSSTYCIYAYKPGFWTWIVGVMAISRQLCLSG